MREAASDPGATYVDYRPVRVIGRARTGLAVAYAHGWSLGRTKMTRPLQADEAAQLHEISFFEVPLGHGPRPAKLHFKHHEGPWTLRAGIPDAEGKAPLREVAGAAPESWEADLATEVPSFGSFDHLYRPEAYDALDFRLTEAGVHG